MTTYFDVKDYLLDKAYKLIIAADAEPFTSILEHGKLVTQISPGGVSVALEPIARAGNAIFVARGKTREDKETANADGYVQVNHTDPYTLKRIFLSDQELADYYYGFANQKLWPLSHIVFEQPVFTQSWYAGFEAVNKKFAAAMQKQEYEKKFYFVNDYQLCLVPKYLTKNENTIIGFFWHIPWPTWEIFRILPHKKEILESLLHCDFLAFHRGYHARNFFNCVRRELEARIDEEKGTIYYANNVTRVTNLPMGIDTDVIRDLSTPDDADFLTSFVKDLLGTPKTTIPFRDIFQKTRVILGVDRLDYTKGLIARLEALQWFFEKHPRSRGNVTYLGFLAVSRKEIPSYRLLKKAVEAKAKEINGQFGTKNWQPIQLLPGIFSRQELIALYKHASVCLVTPLDDGMNLVSKEFVIAASTADDPGVIVLSQFAGSATDLTQSLIINPYDINQTASAIDTALKMSKRERKERIASMAKTLDSHNVYSWAQAFLEQAEEAAKENRKISF